MLDSQTGKFERASDASADNRRQFTGVHESAAVGVKTPGAFICGGATQSCSAGRTSTIDIELKIIPESDEIFRSLPDLKEGCTLH